MTRIYRDRPEDIAQVINLLSEGSVVAVPTETVYGLAADAFNEEATRQIFKMKGRPFIDPLIVHTHDLEGVSRIASLNKAAVNLADKFWPGPLTIVLPKKPGVPAIVTADLNTVAVRVPKHPVLRKVLEDSRLCLAAPSANPFGYLSPTRIEHVLESLGELLEYALDGGPCPIGMESTIIDVSNPEKPVLLRPGAITVEMLSEAVGLPVAINIPRHKAALKRPEGMPAPGMLQMHYSPNTPLIILEPGKSSDKTDLPNTAVVYFNRKGSQPTLKNARVYWLTEDGDLAQAARNLYHLLRAIDGQGHDTIYIEAVPEEGIGAAIVDRIKRASKGN